MIIHPISIGIVLFGILLQKEVMSASLLKKGMSALSGLAGGGKPQPSQNGKCRQVVIVGEAGPDDSAIANKLKAPLQLPKITLPKFGKKKKKKKRKHHKHGGESGSSFSDLEEMEDYKDFREYKRTHNGNSWMNSSPKNGNPEYYQNQYQGRYPYSHSMYAYAAPPQPISPPPPPPPPPQYQYQYQVPPPPAPMPQYPYQYQAPPPPPAYY